MNKYIEALDSIQHIVLDKEADGYYEPKTVHDFYYGYVQILQELVDKAIPKKPIMYKPRSVERPYCGFCNLRLKKSWIVCPRCATRIDWGDNDE